MNITSNWTKWIPVFIMGVLLIFVYKMLDNLTEIGEMVRYFITVVSPFLLAILIVYFLYIPCKKIEEAFQKSNTKWVARKARILSVLLVYLIIVVLIILTGVFIVPVLISSIVDLATNIPYYLENLVDWVNKMPENSLLIDFDVRENLNNFVNNNLHALFSPSNVEQYLSGIFNFASSIFNVVISMVASMYILLERENIINFFSNIGNSLFKPKTTKMISKYLEQVNKVLFTFIGSKGVDSLVNMIVITPMLILFDVKYGFLLGIMCGVASFIPYLGSLVAVIVVSAITFITGGLAQAFTVLISLIIFQQIDANFVEPKIMKTTLKISPLLVIFSVTVGGAYFGLVGMFLGVPIATILKQIIIEFIESRKMDETITIVEK